MSLLLLTRRRPLCFVGAENADTTLPDFLEDKVQPLSDHSLRSRTLWGHRGKIYSSEWAEDSIHLLSAGQEGKLLLWHAPSTDKVAAVGLESNWVMACTVNPGGTLCASGGLDNTCTVHKLDVLTYETDQTCIQELKAHDGFLSSCKFLDDTKLLTSSGDGVIIMWDPTSGAEISRFAGHANDVSSLAVDREGNRFVSVSLDGTCRLWDPRMELSATVMAHNHEEDVNSIKWFPNMTAFGRFWRLDCFRLATFVVVQRATTPWFTLSAICFWKELARTIQASGFLISAPISSCPFTSIRGCLKPQLHPPRARRVCLRACMHVPACASLPQL